MTPQVDADRLLYLYAIVPAQAPAAAALEPGRLRGIADAPVFVIVEGKLAAVAADVPAADFDEAPLNRRLGDLDWLAPRATAHQDVNATIFEQCDAMLPLSFGTVFRSEESLRRLLREDGAGFAAALERLRGCSEWVVTLRRDDQRALLALGQPGGALARLQAEMASANPGRRFLLQRQEADLRRRELLNATAAAVKDVESTVQPLVRQLYHEPVVAATAAPSVPAGGDPRPGQVVARLSLLLERAREPELAARVREVGTGWRERGFIVDLSGPWPPYRFGRVTAHDPDGRRGVAQDGDE